MQEKEEQENSMEEMLDIDLFEDDADDEMIEYDEAPEEDEVTENGEASKKDEVTEYGEASKEDASKEELGDSEQKRERKKKRRTRRGPLYEAVSFLLYIAAAVLITFLIITFVGQRTVVNGPSMEYTLLNGDNIILDKISYRFHAPKRFDVVVFPVENEEKNYIKRIIGLPGETIQIIDGFVYLISEDGEQKELEESYGKEIMLDDGRMEYLTTAPYTLGEDEYYVLGDNRNNSTDSRKIGAVKRSDIIGRAWVRIYPFATFGKIH